MTPTAAGAADPGDLAGRTIVVTGGNSGIGLEAARALAARGARVVLACRDLAKARAAAASIAEGCTGAQVETQELDLASLDAVRKAADAIRARCPALHALCNNAGVFAQPYARTADGFEMQLGINHLGHFALTGLVLEALLRTPGSRVVTVSSLLHRRARIDFDDLQLERDYDEWDAYARSKLANLMFHFELQRRLEAAGVSTISVGCHPGYTATNLLRPRADGFRVFDAAAWLGNRLIAQSAARGALPTVYAATAPDVRGGDYIGPRGLFEAWGRPKRVRCSARARDREAAARLFEVSAELTGVGYEALAG